MSSGAQLPAWRFGPVAPESMRLLADVLNDPNPIHLDPVAAAAAGLGTRVINQGPANLAYVFNMLESAGLEAITLEARFTGNVRGGDEVEAVGVRDNERCTFILKTTDGAPALQGMAIVKVAR